MSNQSRESVRQAWVDRVDRFHQPNQTASEFFVFDLWIYFEGEYDAASASG